MLLHALLRAGPRVRAVLQALARAHHVADAGDDRVMGHRGGRRVMGAVGTRGRRHVRRRARQGRAGPAPATLVPAAAAAPARLPVLHQHRHRHPPRRARTLQQTDHLPLDATCTGDANCELIITSKVFEKKIIN